MGAEEGVTVSDVLLPLAGVPLMVVLGEVLAVELSESDSLGVLVIPPVELLDAQLIGFFFVGGEGVEHYGAHQDYSDCESDYGNRGKIKSNHVFPAPEVGGERFAVIVA